MNDNLSWPAARTALCEGKKVRRSLWISWIYMDRGDMVFDLPENWRGGRDYEPTYFDVGAKDWEVFA
jgi:hypothetical protein